MTIMGGFYREYLAGRGLAGPADCAPENWIYFRADSDQRTVETARALAETMRPGCRTEVHSELEGTQDPLFDPVAAGAVKPDPKLSRAAVMGRNRIQAGGTD